MSETHPKRLGVWLVGLWVAAMEMLLLVGVAAALRYPWEPIQLGLVDARGFAAVCATAIPAICGLWALLGLLQNRRSTPILLLLFSGYWLVLPAGAFVLAAAHGHLDGTFHLTPWDWLIRWTTFAVMIACPALVARWSLASAGIRVFGRAAS